MHSDRKITDGWAVVLAAAACSGQPLGETATNTGSTATLTDGATDSGTMEPTGGPTTGATSTGVPGTDSTSTGTPGTDVTSAGVTGTDSTGTDATGTDVTGAVCREDTEATGPEPPANCGDGVVQADESCDDGNTDPDDGCDADCRFPAVVLWTVSWNSDGAHDDLANGLVVGGDGLLYVVGASENSDTGFDATVRKLGDKGVELLRFTHDDAWSNHDIGRAVAVAADGSVFLGASQAGPTSAISATVLKFDAAANKTWQFLDVATLDNGDSAVQALPIRGDTMYITGFDEVDPGFFRASFYRYAADTLEEVWRGEILKSIGDGGQGAAVASNGDLVIGSGVFEAGMMVPVVARFAAADGQEVWRVVFSCGPGVAAAVAVNEEGDIAVTGHVQAGATDDVWTARLGSDGSVIWIDEFDHAVKEDHGRAIAWSGNDLYVAGSLTGAALRDAFVRRYTGDGTPVWTGTYNGAVDGDDVATGVAIRGQEVVVVGTEQTADEGDNQWIRAYAP